MKFPSGSSNQRTLFTREILTYYELLLPLPIICYDSFCYIAN